MTAPVIDSAVLAEDVDWLLECGEHPERIARRLCGGTVDALAQRLRRSGHYGLARKVQRAMTAAPIPECDTPQVVFEELIEEIRYAIDSHPRSQQVQIGPSEIGEPCDRALIAKLAGLPEPEEPPNWRAWVGTAIHAELERIFSRSIHQTDTDDGRRFLLEQRVTVGQIGGADITGSCDLFDTATGQVWDWKTKSKTQLSKHRRNGPGEKYRAQFHLYGRGMANAGHRVAFVGMIVLPRDGDLTDAFHWAEPYDEQIAIDAIARANQLGALAQLLGAKQAMAQYPKCTDEFCRVCGNYRAPFGSPKGLATSTRDLFAAK